MTLIPRYAGVGTTCPSWNIAVSSGGSFTSSGTLYFSFQLQNRVGFNIPSVSGAIAYSPSQKITITIPDTVQKDGWDIHAYILSAGTTNDPATHVEIARIPGFQYGVGIDPQSLRTVLPQDIVLSRDTHIALAPTVANPAALPTGVNRLDGQVRYITSVSGFFEYRADSTATLSTDVLTADTGRWHRVGSASTYVSDTTSGNGSDRPVTSINPATVIPTPDYPVGNEKVLPTWEEQFWIYNQDGYILPAGTEFGIEIGYNFKRSPDLLNGLFEIKFLGYVQSDGSIRDTTTGGTPFDNTGGFVPWTPTQTTPFLTPDDLAIGEAIAIAVKPYFSVAEFEYKYTPGSVVSILPSIRVQSGTFNPLGSLLPKGIVYYEGDRYRVVPNIGNSFDILSGAALVASYSFPLKPRRTFGGLENNTADQKIIINGSGAVYAEEPSYAPTVTEAIRAIVSTELGTSETGTYSSYTAITSGQAIALTLSYPCDADGFGTVRSDYPDVIADSDKGKFNPAQVVIYLQRQDTSEIRSFSGFTVIPGTSQSFTLTAWLSGTIVPSLPTADADFSLWEPGTTAIAPTTGGTFPATSYRATYAFYYDGGQITKISHTSPPCIEEWPGDFTPPTVEVGTTTTLPAGSSATVVNVGTPNNAILNFGIPRGADGSGGGTAGIDQILTFGGEVLVGVDGKVLYF